MTRIPSLFVLFAFLFLSLPVSADIYNKGDYWEIFLPAGSVTVPISKYSAMSEYDSGNSLRCDTNDCESYVADYVSECEGQLSDYDGCDSVTESHEGGDELYYSVYKYKNPENNCESGNHRSMTFNDGSSPETTCFSGCEYTKTGSISVGMADGSWMQNMKSTGSSCSQSDSLPSPDSSDPVDNPDGGEPDAPTCGDGEQLGTVNGEYSCQPTGDDGGSDDGSGDGSGDDGSTGDGSDDGSDGGGDGGDGSGGDDGSGTGGDSGDGSDGSDGSGDDSGTGGGSGGDGTGGDGDGEGVGTPGVDAGDFYESKNPDGVEKVMSDFKSEIEETQLMKSIDGFFDVDINGYSCPVWTIPSVMKMPAITIDQQCSSAMNQVWPGIAAIIIATCGFYAFRIAVL
ncbi:hypothetical protein [Vreelandella utahensis]|nr:hypothetical protein [Halomonas utahensis]